MKFVDIIEKLDLIKVNGAIGVEISGICADTRKVKNGDLLICFKGASVDMHDFVADAKNAGAVAIVCEKEIECDLPYVVVKNARKTLSLIAKIFYGCPDEKLKIVGITGTNGKTTTTYMLKSIFDNAQKSCGVIGTLGISYANKTIAPELTTPDPLYLFSVLADMVECGVKYVFMEVSAHAIFYEKVRAIKFDVVAFSNCSQDHLDFFGTMNNYSQVKKSFFDGEHYNYAVINADDKVGLQIISKHKNVISYGLNNPCDVFAVDVVERSSGSSFVINLFDDLHEIRLSMPALHNVYNALCASATAKLLGISLKDIAVGLSSLKGVDGRLEKVGTYNGADVFVDFAHTPDGLEKSLSALKNLYAGNLICVFGCGGNRDVSKRPEMGKISAKYADFSIITSDNPRYEDPYEIISQIEVGVRGERARYVTVTDRQTATEYAMGLLQSGDVLLVAGKGGENYQEIMGIKHVYNDKNVIRNIIG